MIYKKCQGCVHYDYVELFGYMYHTCIYHDIQKNNDLACENKLLLEDSLIAGECVDYMLDE